MLYAARAQLSGERRARVKDIERRRVDGGIFENLVREADGQKRHACRGGHERSLVRRTERNFCNENRERRARAYQPDRCGGGQKHSDCEAREHRVHIRQAVELLFHYQQRDCLNGDRAYDSRKYRPECERAVVIPADYSGCGEHEQIARIGTFRRFYAFESCHKTNLSVCRLIALAKILHCTPRGRVILYKAENFLFIKEGMRFEDTGAD